MYIKHGLIYLLAKVFPVLASFISLAAYTRWLTPTDYGMYAAITVLASSLLGFLFGWINIGIMRFWGSEGMPEAALQRLLVVTVVVVTVVLGVLALGYAMVTGRVAIAGAFFLLFASAAVYESYQRINVVSQQAQGYLRLELSKTVVTLALGLGLVWQGYSWFGLSVAVALGSLLPLLVVGALWQYIAVPWRGVDRQVFLKMLRYGLPLSVSAALLEIIYTSGRLLLGVLESPAAAGEYTVAYNVPHQLMMIFASSLNMAAYPMVVQALEREGQAVAEAKFRHYLLVLSGVLIPVWLGIVGISHSFIPLVIGAEFVPSSLALWPWVGAAILGHCLYSFYVLVALQLAQRTMAAVKVAVLGAVLNVVLNVVLIPGLGVLGAAVASLLAYAFCVGYGYYLGFGGFRLLIPWVGLSKVVLAAVVMLGAMAWVQDAPQVGALLLKAWVGGMVYAVMVVLFNIGGIQRYLKQMLATQWVRWQRNPPL